MDSLLDTAKQDIQEKLEWAKRSFQKLQKNKNDYSEIKDNFWSFLSAFQQSLNYYNKFIEESKSYKSKNQLKKTKKELINNWKSKMLTNDENVAWEVLNKLRNHDTHNNPVQPNYEIKLMLCVDDDESVFLDYDGVPFVIPSKRIGLYYDNKKYDIEYLCQNGIISIEKLIEDLQAIFPQEK